MANKFLVKKRLDNFRSVLRGQELDALLLVNYTYTGSSMYSDFSILYLSNLVMRFDNAVFLLTPDDYRLWIDEWDFERAKKESWLENLESESIAGWLMPPDAFAKKAVALLRGKAGRGKIRVGFNGQAMRGGVLNSLLQHRGVEWIDVSTDLVRSRLAKDALEKEALRSAAKIADVGLETVVRNVREGVSELELEAAAENEIRLAGAQGSWFSYGFGFVAFGPETAESTSGGTSPSKRKLKRGEIVSMDFTPFYNGYGADVARSFVFGSATREQSEAFGLVKDILDAQAASLRGGMTVGELRRASLEPTKGQRLGKDVTGLGHGIGLYEDVYPLFTPAFDDVVLPTGMAVALEPEVTMKGTGVMRLEDNYILTPSGAERLTNAPIVESVG